VKQSKGIRAIAVVRDFANQTFDYTCSYRRLPSRFGNEHPNSPALLFKALKMQRLQVGSGRSKTQMLQVV